MALDFPASPTTGDRVTLNSVIYEFDGDKWVTIRSLFDRGRFVAGTAAEPGFSVSTDANTGLYAPGADQLAFTTGGVERVEFGTSEVVFNDGGIDYDFRIEGDADVNLVFADASTDRIGIGTSAPSVKVDIEASEPYVTLKNTTEEDTDGGREVRIDFEGEQSGGEASTLARIEVSHDGAADDEKGKVVISTNDGADGATPTARATIDSSGRLLVGTSSARNNFFNTTIFSPGLQLEGADTSSAGTGQGRFISVVYGNTFGNGSGLILGSTRSGTVGQNTIVQANDGVGAIHFQGADGTELVETARIAAQVDGTPGADNMPGRLVFSTNPGSPATSPAERMRIRSDGNVSIADGNLIFASGHGIDFSATADPGTSTESELFSDYEHGRWTPTIVQGATSISHSRAYYIKTGDVVYVSAAITLTGGGASVLQIGNLPYAGNNSIQMGPSTNAKGYETTGSVMIDDPSVPASAFMLTTYFYGGTNAIQFYWSRSGLGWLAATGSSISGAVIFSLSYLVA